MTLSVSTTTGIYSDKRVAHDTHSLLSITEMHQLDLAMCSINTEWCREGMRALSYLRQQSSFKGIIMMNILITRESQCFSEEP